MEVWISINILVLCLGQIQTYDVDDTQQVMGCRSPVIQILDVSLVPSKDFPRQDYTAALKNDPNRRDVEDMIKLKKTELRNAIKMEEKLPSPAAKWYEPMCKSSCSIVEHWRVVGRNCWTIEPVIWRHCNQRPLDSFSYVDEVNKEGYGFSCKSDYMPQTLLVYCKQTVSPIRNMTVYVSYKCCLKWYFCQ